MQEMTMPKRIDDAALHQIILDARTAKAKERLKSLLEEGNKEKTMQAPVCAIIGYDLKFYEYLPELFPHADAKSWFEGKPDFIKTTSFRNGTLQGAYLIIAARALGLDCGPMSGFNNVGVDKEFFAGTDIKSNLVTWGMCPAPISLRVSCTD